MYAAFESLFTAVFLILATLAIRGPARLVRDWRTIPHRAAAMSGAGIVLAYGLVLVAFGFARNVSYVVAFRQVSLPLGTLLSVLVLHERLNGPRVVGTLAIIAGLVMVALE